MPSHRYAGTSWDRFMPDSTRGRKILAPPAQDQTPFGDDTILALRLPVPSCDLLMSDSSWSIVGSLVTGSSSDCSPWNPTTSTNLIPESHPTVRIASGPGPARPGGVCELLNPGPAGPRRGSIEGPGACQSRCDSDAVTCAKKIPIFQAEPRGSGIPQADTIL